MLDTPVDGAELGAKLATLCHRALQLLAHTVKSVWTMERTDRSGSPYYLSGIYELANPTYFEVNFVNLLTLKLASRRVHFNSLEEPIYIGNDFNSLTR
jgi:hypothetical protein